MYQRIDSSRDGVADCTESTDRKSYRIKQKDTERERGTQTNQEIERPSIYNGMVTAATQLHEHPETGKQLRNTVLARTAYTSDAQGPTHGQLHPLAWLSDCTDTLQTKVQEEHLKGIEVSPGQVPSQHLPHDDAKGVHICCLTVALVSHNLHHKPTVATW